MVEQWPAFGYSAPSSTGAYMPLSSDTIRILWIIFAVLDQDEVTRVQILILSKFRYIPERNDHTKASTQMFIAGLFIIAKKHKQCECPWIGEYVSRMRCVCLTECDFTIERNEVMIHITTGMNLEIIMLNERSWSQKATHYYINMIPFYTKFPE